MINDIKVFFGEINDIEVEVEVEYIIIVNNSW